MPNTYSRRARLAPAVLAAKPAVILIGGALWAPATGDSLAAIAIGALALVICGLVRESGRRLRPSCSRAGAAPRRSRGCAGRATTPSRCATCTTPSPRSPATGSPANARRPPTPPGQTHTTRRPSCRCASSPVMPDVSGSSPRRTPSTASGQLPGLRPYALAAAGVVAIVSIVALATGPSHPGRYWPSLAASVAALAGWYLIVKPRGCDPPPTATPSACSALSSCCEPAPLTSAGGATQGARRVAATRASQHLPEPVVSG